MECKCACLESRKETVIGKKATIAATAKKKSNRKKKMRFLSIILKCLPIKTVFVLIIPIISRFFSIIVLHQIFIQFTPLYCLYVIEEEEGEENEEKNVHRALIYTF